MLINQYVTIVQNGTGKRHRRRIFEPQKGRFYDIKMATILSLFEKSHPFWPAVLFVNALTCGFIKSTMSDLRFWRSQFQSHFCFLGVDLRKRQNFAKKCPLTCGFIEQCADLRFYKNGIFDLRFCLVTISHTFIFKSVTRPFFGGFPKLWADSEAPDKHTNSQSTHNWEYWSEIDKVFTIDLSGLSSSQFEAILNLCLTKASKYSTRMFDGQFLEANFVAIFIITDGTWKRIKIRFFESSQKAANVKSKCENSHLWTDCVHFCKNGKKKCD